MRVTTCRRAQRGQALVEFALVAPIFFMTVFALITFGLAVFYQQQLTNAAREAARYAAVHSATAQCPTVSRVDPPDVYRPASGSYWRCDAPENGWPKMTAAGRRNIWGIAPSLVGFAACWSGYVDGNSPPNADALPTSPNTFAECTMGGTSPRSDMNSLPCPPPATRMPTAPMKADGDDKASNAAGQTYSTNEVTVYACMQWRPPMAGFVFIPNVITMRAVVTESVQRQQ